MADTKNQSPLSWLSLGDVDKPTSDVQSIFDATEEQLGFVRNMQRLMANVPELLVPLMALSHALMYSDYSGLSLRERELVALVVSAENKCIPCIFAHAAGLRSVADDPAWVATMKANYRHADLSVRERAIADYASRLTIAPREMGPADLKPLRDNGLTDIDIIYVAEIAAYFNLSNRFNSGLGIHPNAEDYASFR
ncbi:peroxidase-related enzyme [Brucella intermedia]|uniref:peroxidase-related enzyme n=1 Tax=Brucella intermedia TaxID=94625 RepID=UPI002363139F|nr:peroxidase-related enzyme [Brucella intermedia]